jgi:predicted O-methyltransferase YrrM
LYDTVKRLNEPSCLEIGFYGGHSAFIMSIAGGFVTAIDPCSYGFERDCAAHLPVHLIGGTSRERLQGFTKYGIIRSFDVIHIDGSHDISEVIFDITECKKLCHDYSLVVIDDWDGIEQQLPKEIKDMIEVIEVAICENPNALVRYK